MAGLAISRIFLPISTHFPRHFSPSLPPLLYHFLPHFPHFSTTTSSITNPTASFDWSDDDSSPTGPTPPPSPTPPPYDPFSKKPAITEPNDPTNLQEIFHKMRTEGLTDYAVKMFDALSRDGLTHEALSLFSVIKSTSSMPDVVAHTAVIEAYANAGNHSKNALQSFDRMLASGVAPNAYTYSVLIKGLARDGRVGDARRLVGEMVGKGMRPNAVTCVAVMEAYVKEGKEEEARGLTEEMRVKGVVPEEKAVREVLEKRGHVFRAVIGLLYGK